MPGMKHCLPSFGACKVFCVFGLKGRNELSGSVPSQLGQLSSLGQLYLFDTELTGRIPSELDQMLALQYLYLDDNALTGTLSTEVGRLQGILRIYAYMNNQLSGSLPSQLG